MQHEDLARLAFDPRAVERHAWLATMHGPLDAWLRQSPNWDGVWAKTRFSIDPQDDRTTWLATCDEPPQDALTTIPRERRILFIGEPPSVKRYPPAYLKQFGTVVAPLPLPGYAGRLVRQHSALPWHYGRSRPIEWRRLAAPKPKDALLSVFCSDKSATPQQRARLAFVDRLERHFGGRIARFGTGVAPLPEKADGIDPYRYHVVLENNREIGFWTEKLADSYLGDAFPFYAGGRIDDGDFDAAARVDIDIDDPATAIRTIEATIEADLFAHSRQILQRQRGRIMIQHNFLAVADRIISEASDRTPRLRRPVRLLQSHEATGAAMGKSLWRRFLGR